MGSDPMNNYGTITVDVRYNGTHDADRESISVEVVREFTGPSAIPEVAEEAVKRALAAASAQ